MDTIMADNFLKELLTNMQGQLNRLEEKVDKNHRELSKRVNTIEDSVSDDIKKKDLPASPLQNPKVVQILFFVALTVLLLVAAVVGVDIGGLI